MRLFIATLFVTTAFAASNPVRVVESECPLVSNQPTCQFRNGYLMRFSHAFDPVIRVYAPDGQFALNIPVSLPATNAAWADDVAVDSDGSFAIAATGSVEGNERLFQHALVLDDRNGLQTQVINTNGFAPGHVAFGADHSIWVVGYQSSRKGDYNILRHYSRTGELLGSWLPRSTFPAGLDPGSASDPTALLIAENRIVVVAFAGKVGSSLELIELDTNGQVMGHMPWQSYGPTNFAFTSDRHLYSYENDSKKHEFNLMDVEAGTVKNLEPPLSVGYLMGADGNDLVYRLRDDEQKPGITIAGWFLEPVLQ